MFGVYKNLLLPDSVFPMRCSKLDWKRTPVDICCFYDAHQHLQMWSHVMKHVALSWNYLLTAGSPGSRTGACCVMKGPPPLKPCLVNTYALLKLARHIYNGNGAKTNRWKWIQAMPKNKHVRQMWTWGRSFLPGIFFFKKKMTGSMEGFENK